jgi:UvrD-like helicase C-terminal domain
MPQDRRPNGGTQHLGRQSRGSEYVKHVVGWEAPRTRSAAEQLLLACEEQLLPSWRALSSTDPGRLEEEGRLFYVAGTRAKDRLIITHAAQRGRQAIGVPSRFLAEAGLVEVDARLAA